MMRFPWIFLAVLLGAPLLLWLTDRAGRTLTLASRASAQHHPNARTPTIKEHTSG